MWRKLYAWLFIFFWNCLSLLCIYLSPLEANAFMLLLKENSHSKTKAFTPLSTVTPLIHTRKLSISLERSWFSLTVTVFVVMVLVMVGLDPCTCTNSSNHLPVFFCLWKQSLIIHFLLLTDTTRDEGVFSFQENDSPCQGFEHVLECYRKNVPNVQYFGQHFSRNSSWKPDFLFWKEKEICML